MPVLEVCERGYLIQLKEYERGTLQKGNGLDFGGGGGGLEDVALTNDLNIYCYSDAKVTFVM